MNNRAWILSALLAFRLLDVQVWGAEVDRSGIGVPKNSAQNHTGDVGDLKLRHRWTDTVLLGFNSAGHCLVFNRALRTMEAHDLSASPNSKVICRNLWESKLVGSGQNKIYLEISPDWKLARISNMPANWREIRVELRDFTDPEVPGPVAKPLADAQTNRWSVVGYSPNGKLLALKEQSGLLRFWDTETNRIIDRPAMKIGQAFKMIFSPDHQWLAVYVDERMREGSAAGNIRVLEVATGQPIGPPQPISGMFLDWLIDRESRFLAVSYVDGNGDAVEVWKLPDSHSLMWRSPKWLRRLLE